MQDRSLECVECGRQQGLTATARCELCDGELRAASHVGTSSVRANVTPVASTAFDALPRSSSYRQPVVVVTTRPGPDGFAIASLVLGILWLYWLGSVLALVFGYVALSRIKRRPTEVGGRG